MTELIPSGVITNGPFIRGQWGWVEDAVSSVTVRGDQTPQGERRHESSSGHDLNLLSVWPASLSGLSECLFSLWEEKDSLASRNHEGWTGTRTAAESQESEARRAPQPCCCCCCCSDSTLDWTLSGRDRFNGIYVHVVVRVVVPRRRSGFLIWSTSLHAFYRNISDS